MALLVLLCLGASLGWLASILARTEAPREILRQIALAMVVATAAGLFVNIDGVLGSLSLLAIGAGTVAAIVALVIYHMIFRRGDRAKT
jgi:uncharacterized membrane protein YeaQ/YmgE (transglycosylase-associated protein family)